MHPDRKIGIAMGILLVGVVAALFFRNEPLDVDDSLTMRRERELNERLRERDVAIYLDGDARDREDGEDPLEFNLKDLFGRLDSQHSGPPIPLAAPGVIESKPLNSDVKPQAPLKFHPPVDEPPEEVASHQSADSERDTPSDSLVSKDSGMAEIFQNPGSHAEGGESGNKTPSGDFEEYTVRFGDTLSGISERVLGSQNRFREIYDINKDRISNPDRLQVGKAIRVPRVIR